MTDISGTLGRRHDPEPSASCERPDAAGTGFLQKQTIQPSETGPRAEFLAAFFSSKANFYRRTLKFQQLLDAQPLEIGLHASVANVCGKSSWIIAAGA